MNPIRPKLPRLRLDSKSYQQLRRDVLRRDGWRCQFCGRLENLQIHHKQLRSGCGGDSEHNLITLCAGCHRSVHEGQNWGASPRGRKCFLRELC